MQGVCDWQEGDLCGQPLEAFVAYVTTVTTELMMSLTLCELSREPPLPQAAQLWLYATCYSSQTDWLQDWWHE